MTWPAGYGRRVLSRVDSTMSEAARIAPELSGPEWVLALQQTAARGRRGRVWHMPEGNFSATLILRPEEPPERLAMRSFVAALALFEAFEQVSGTAQGLALKWPNDVLVNGGKVAGILLESLGGPTGALAIGFGVNLIAAPRTDAVEPGAVAPVSLLEETGKRVTPEGFLEALAAAYARWEARLVTYGFEPVRAAWLERAARLGEVISARTTRDETVGTFETVDGQGNLVLKTSDKRVAIAAADVFF